MTAPLVRPTTLPFRAEQLFKSLEPLMPRQDFVDMVGLWEDQLRALEDLIMLERGLSFHMKGALIVEESDEWPMPRTGYITKVVGRITTKSTGTSTYEAKVSGNVIATLSHGSGVQLVTVDINPPLLVREDDDYATVNATAVGAGDEGLVVVYVLTPNLA